MSESSTEVPVGTEGEVTEPTGSAPVEPPVSGDNPAWSKFMDVLPTSLHETVKPVLKEWDQGVNAKFQEYQSQIDPWKSFIEEKVDPQSLAQARQLYNALESDPRAFYDQMAKYYEFTAEPIPGTPPPVAPVADASGGIDFGDPTLNAWAEQQAAKIAEQEKLIVTMGQAFLGERQQAEQALTTANQDQMLADAMTSAKTKHGEFNEQMVLTLMSQHGYDFKINVEIINNKQRIKHGKRKNIFNH